MRQIWLSKLCILKISSKKQVVERCSLPKEMFLDHYEVLLFLKVNQIPFLKHPETNISAPENRPSQNIPKGWPSVPATHFQVLLLSHGGYTLKLTAWGKSEHLKCWWDWKMLAFPSRHLGGKNWLISGVTKTFQNFHWLFVCLSVWDVLCWHLPNPSCFLFGRLDAYSHSTIWYHVKTGLHFLFLHYAPKINMSLQEGPF